MLHMKDAEGAELGPAGRRPFGRALPRAPRPTCVLEYSNATIRVRVNYELGSLPWVTLHRTGKTSDRMKAEAINLDVALADFGLHRPITDWSPEDVPDEVLRQMIDFQAEALRKTCEPYLRGEFGQEWSRLVEEHRAVFERRRGLPDGGVG